MIINKDGSWREKEAPATEPEPKDRAFVYDVGNGLCRRGTDIWLNHRYGPRWICARCGFQVDIKQLMRP